MKANRFFLKFSSKRNQKTAAAKLASLRKPSALAGSILALAAVMLPIQKADAANLYWRTVGNGTWQTAGNWTTDSTGSTVVGSAVPGAADVIFFNGSTINGAEIISLNAATAASGITFNNTGATTLQSDTTTSRILTLGTTGMTVASTAGAVTIGSATNATTITLSGAQTWTNNSTTNALTIVNALTLGANQLTIAGLGTTNINGAVGGTAGLVVGTGASSGTVLNLGTTNTFTGDISINGGTLVYSGGTTTNTSRLGLSTTGTTFKQILLTNGGTFRTTSTFDDNVNSTTNKGAGVIFNIGAGGGTFSVDTGAIFSVNDGAGGGTATTATQLQGTGTLTKTGLGVLVLGNGGAANNSVFTGQILVNSGVLRTTSTGAGVGFGSTSANTVIASGAALDLANSTSTTAESLTINGTGAGTSATYNANAGNGTNAIYATGTASTFAGAITLGSNSTIGSGGTAGTMTLSGNISGANSLTINNLAGGGTTLTGAAINNTGTITNSGAGAGATIISGAIGGNVTQINQNSSTSALTVSGAVTVGATNKVFNSGGTSLFTVSGGTKGTGNVTFNANSSGNFTVSTAAINHVGTLTNSGSSTGDTTINSVIGSNVTSVIQNSAGSALILGTANTWTGSLVIKAGTVQPKNATSITTISGLTLGDTGGSTSPVLLNFTTASQTLAKPILVTGNGQAQSITISDTNFTASLTGLITFANNATLNIDQGTTADMTVTGGTANTGNIVYGNSGTGGSLTVSGVSVNHIGTITNSGSNVSPTIISASIGSNVTGVTQNSATSPLTLSGNNASYAGTTTLAQGLLNINSANALGTGAFVVSGVGAATINNSSAADIVLTPNNAITLNGNLTFTGTKSLDLGTGAVSLGAAAGTARTVTVTANILTIGGIISDGATATGLTKAGNGQLVVNGGYTGATTVNAGALVVAGSMAGNTGALTVAGNSAFSLLGNSANPMGSISTLTFGTAAQTSVLGLELGASTALSDSLTTAGTAVTAGTINLNINAITGFGTASSYNLITATGGGLGGASYVLNSAPGGFAYTLTPTGTSVDLGVAAGAGGDIWWHGAVNGSWSSFAGVGGTSNWSAFANGASDTNYAPGTANTVNFSTTNAAIGTITTTLDSNFAINNLKFLTPAGAVSAVTINPGFTLGATNTLTIAPTSSGDGIALAQGVGAVTINAPVVLGAAQTWSVDSTTPGVGTASSLTVSGAISGLATNGLTFTTTAGTTPIILSSASGTSTYSGPSAVSASTIVQGGATNAFSPNTAWTVNGTLNTGAFNQATGSLVGGSGFVQNGSGTNTALTIGSDNLASATFGGTIQDGSSGTLGLTKAGTGAQTLSGTNTYTGSTIVSNGTLNITGTLNNGGTGAFAYGNSPTRTIVNVSGDMTVGNITGANNAGSNAVYNQTAGNVNSTSSQFASWVANNGGYGYFNLTGGTFVTSGGFNTTVNGGNTSTGVAYLAANLDSSSATGNMVVAYSASSLGSLTVAPGGTLNYSGSTGTFFLTVSANTYGVLNIAGGDVNFGTRALRFGNAGANQTGFINLAGGTLTLGQNFSTVATSTNVYVNYAGGTLKALANLNNPFSPGAGVTTVATIFGTIDNSAAVGNTSQNFTGGLTVDTNTNSVTFGNALRGATGNGVKQSNITVTAGSGYIGAPMVQFTGGTFTTPASGYAIISGGAVTGIVITSPGSYTVDPTGVTLTGGGGTGASVALTAFTGNAADTGLTKIGAGTLTLSGANTYTGGTSVTGGTLALGATGTLASAGNLTVSSSGTFDAATFTNTVAGVSLQGSGTLTGSTGGALTSTTAFDLRSGTVSFSDAAGGLGGAVAVNKTTGGTVTLTNAGFGAFNQAVNVNGGTLAFSAGAQLGAAGINNTIGISGGTLSYTSAGPGSLAANQAVTLGAGHGTVEVTQNAGALTLSGTVTAANNNLTKTGPGSLILAGTSNLGTGTVVVSAGALIVNTTLTSSTTTVASTATLGGTGTLSSAVTISSGGMLSPATSTTPGTLTVGSLTLSAGSQLAYEFGGTPPTSDLVAVTTASGLTLNGGSLSLYAAGGVSPLTTNGTYDLFTYSTAFGGSLGNLTVANSQGGKTYAINDTGTIIQLVLGTATSSDWSGTVDGVWTNDGVGNNWNGGSQPNSLGAVANFGNIAVTPQTVTLNGGKTVGSIIFDNTNSFTIGTNSDAITLDNGIAAGSISATLGSHTINAPIILNASANIAPGTGTTITFGGVISGTNKSLTFSGAGTSVLNAANTYSGGTTLSNGTLNLGNNSALGGGALTIGAGTTIDNTKGSLLTNANNNAQNWNGSFTFTGTDSMDLGTGAVTLGASPTITTGNAATTLTVGGAIADGAFSLGITKAGPGTLALAGVNTYNGATSITAGTLSLTGSLTGGGAISTSGTGTFTESAAGVISGASTLTQGSSGSTTLAGNNTYSGGTALSAGTLVLGSTSALGSDALTITGGSLDSSVANLVNANNNTQAWNGNFSFVGTQNLDLGTGAVTLSAARTVTVSAGTLTAGGVVSGGFSLTKLGAGTLVLSGVNTYSGGTTVNEGTLTLSGNRTAAINTINVGVLTGITGTLNITNGTFTAGTTGSTFLLGGGTGGIGILNQSGGTLTTTGNQLLIGNGTGTGTYNLSGGTLNTIAGGLGVTLGVNTGSTATFNLSSAGNLAMAATSTLQITRSDNTAASGITGTFSQTGGTATVGILLMGGSNTTPANGANNNATLSLSGGTFTVTTFNQLSGANNSVSTINIGGTAVVTLPAFPTLRGTGATATINFDGGTLKPAGTSNAYMGGLTNAFIKAGGAGIDTTNGSITISQSLLTDVVSTGGGLTKSGTNTLTLSGTNTYTGKTTVSGGGLSFNTIANVGGGASALGAPTTVPNGTIDLNGTLTYTGGVASTDRVINLTTAAAGSTITNSGSGLLTLNGDITGNATNVLFRGTASITMNGVIGATLTGTVSHTDAGTLTLTNASNAWTGNLVVSAGIVSVDTIANMNVASAIGAGTSITLGQSGFNNTGTFRFTGASGGSSDRDINIQSNTAQTNGGIIENTVAGQLLTLSGNITTGGLGTTPTLGLTGLGNGLLSGNITGSPALAITKSGTGTWTLSGTNTYTGNTAVTGGTLQINGSNAVAGGGTTSQLQIGSGSTGNVIVGAAAGTLTFGGNGFTSAAQVGVGTAAGVGTGTLTINGGTVNLAGTTGTASTSLNIGGQIATNAGTGTVTVNGGTLNVGQRILMGFNNVASNGTLTIAGGAVNVGTNGTLGYTGNDPGSVQFGSGTTTVNLDGGTLSLNGFKSTGATNTINFNGGTVTALGDQSFFIGNNGANDTAPNAIGTITTKVKVGGAIFDTNTFNITIGSALVEDVASTGGGLTKQGTGTLTLSGANTYTGTTTISAGTLQLGNGTTGNDGTIANTSGVTNNADLVFNRFGSSSAGYVIGGSGNVTKIGAGTQILTNTNTYGGTTTVSAGTLTLSGTGSVNGSSGITVNGSGAKFLQTSSTAISPTVTLTQGTLTGNGTVNTVNVGAGTGGIISNNNGVAGASLTIGTLTFNGAATVNTFSSSTSAAIITTSLASNIAGTVTINPTGTWTSNSTYDLISYGGGSIGGAGFGQFTLGAVTGLTGRQTATSLTNSGTAITLLVAGDSPYWVGDGDKKWNLTSTNNWRLLSNNAYDTFQVADDVIFNDNATGAGPVLVNIDVANVAPNSTLFNNITKDYVLSGAFGISTGSLTKSGAGTVTITNANTYTGATTINAGTLQLGDGTTGNDGTIAGTSGVTNNGTLIFNRFGSSSAGYVISGTGAVIKTGAGTQILTNANTYTGATTITAGTLQIGNGGTTGSIASTSGVTNNAALIYNRSNNLTVGYAIGGTGTLEKLGAGILTLTNTTNGYSGATTITTGTLQLGDGTVGNDGTIANTSGVTNNAALIFNRFGSVGAGYAISGTGSVTKLGVGTQTLSGLSATAASNYTGKTTIDQGTLALSSAGTVALTGGLTFGSSATSTNTGTLDLTNASATFGGGLTVQTNSATANVITIGSGKTLTFTGSALTNVVTVGTATAGGLEKLKVTGSGGTLTVNESTHNIVVANTDNTGPGASAQLDLSGLGTFNATVANIYVGRPTTAAGAATNARPNDSLTLAINNNLTVSGSIVVGAATTSPNAGTTQQFLLGQANTINVGSIVVGNGRIPGTFAFNTGLTNPSVTLRGAAGGITRTDIFLGDQGNATGAGNGGGGSTTILGKMDFTGGSVDAKIGTLNVGYGGIVTSNIRANGQGTFIIDGASSNVDVNTLVIAQDRSDASGSTVNPTGIASTGIFTMINGTLVVNTAATLANDIDATNTANSQQGVSATFNLQGGTATIGSSGTPVNLILGNHVAAGNAGLSTAAVNLTGGTLNMFGDIKEGTLGNGTITSSLTLNGATLDMNGKSIGLSGALIDTLTFASGTLRNVAQINNGADLTKTTGGTLFLQGSNNSYTGQTIIQAGTVQADVVDAVATNSQSLGKHTDVTLGAASSSGTLSYVGAAAGTLGKNITAVGNGNDTIANNGGGELTLAGNLTKDGKTLTLNAATNAINVTGNILGSSANSDLIITGNNTTKISGTGNSFNGPTTVNSGATLEVTGSISGTTAVVISGTLLLNNAADNTAINTGAAVTGAGGTLKVSDTKSGQTNTFASLTLTGNSMLDFGTGSNGITNGNTLLFTTSNATTLNAFTLDVRHWSQTSYVMGLDPNTDVTQDRLLFTGLTGVTAGDTFNGISFYDDANSYLGYGQAIAFGGGFEIVPVPEPATTALIGSVALCALIGYRERRRFTGIRRPVGKK